MNPKTEKGVHVTAYVICIVMPILILSAFAPPSLLALFAVPGMARRRAARFVPQQPMPAAFDEATRWSSGRW